MTNSSLQLSSLQVEAENSSTPSFSSNSFFILRVVCVALNAPTAVFALIGNLLILAALRKTSSLHTPSKLLLSNLALTDLCVGLVLQPLYVTILLIEIERGHLISRLVYNSFSYPLSSVSLSTMTVISVDRLLALYKWRTYRTTVTLKRVMVAVVILWLLGVVARLIALYAGFLTYTVMCSTAIFLCAAISSLSFLLIYQKLRRLETQAKDNATTQAQNGDRNNLNVHKFRNSASGMLYLCCATWLCYLPFIVWNLLLGLFSLFPEAREPCMTLVMLNSSLNPVLYCWRIKDVRQATKKVLQSAFHCEPCGPRVGVNEVVLAGAARNFHVAWHAQIE